MKPEIYGNEQNLIIALREPDSLYSAGVLEADLHDWEGKYWVARCLVRKEHRGKGYGTQLLTRLCEVLDRLKKGAYLVPNPYDHTISMRRLVAFYERFGFVKIDRPGGTVWMRDARC